MKKILLLSGLIMMIGAGSANAWTPRYQNHNTQRTQRHNHNYRHQNKHVKVKTIKRRYRHQYRHQPKVVVYKPVHHARPKVVVVEKQSHHNNHGNMLGAFFLGFLFGHNG